MQALIYTRVSTTDQADEGTSLDSQLAACVAYADERGYSVAGTYSDSYTGAQYRERPGLTELRQALTTDVDVVICYALDRLSRNQAHVAILVEEITDAGAKLELVTEEFEDSAVGRFILSARAFVAEVEREKIAERTARGRRARVESGKIMPGPKPKYGYNWNDDRTAMIINEVEATIVRRMVREALAGGSLRSIALGLEADGIHAPGGGETWWPSTVRRILTDTSYTGEAYGLRWTTEDRRRKELGPDEAIRLPDGTVPALISPEDQAAIVRQISAGKWTAPRNNPTPEASLLRAGFAWCALCETPLSVSNTTNIPYGQYRCRAPIPHKRRTHYLAISRTGLDDAVWERVQAFMLSDMLISHIAAAHDAASAPSDRELRASERALAQIDRQRSNLTRAIGLTDDPNAAAALLTQLEELAAQRQAIEDQRAHLQQAFADKRAFQRSLDDLDAWRQHVAANMATMAYQEKRQLLQRLGLKVHVLPASHDPRWHITSAIFPDIVWRSPGSVLRNVPGARLHWPDPID